MTNNELYLIMKQVISLATDCPTIIKSNPNARAPGGDYCSISVTQPKRQRGQANITKANSDDTVTSPIGEVYNVEHEIKSQNIAEISCNFYRGDAHQYAEYLFQANKRPDVQDYLRANKVGWNGVSQVNNLDALQSENWEDRAQITVRLMYEQSVTVTTNAIYQVPVEVEDFDIDETIESIDVVSPNP